MLWFKGLVQAEVTTTEDSDNAGTTGGAANQGEPARSSRGSLRTLRSGRPCRSGRALQAGTGERPIYRNFIGGTCLVRIDDANRALWQSSHLRVRQPCPRRRSGENAAV